jgi:hypothetical protein
LRRSSTELLYFVINSLTDKIQLDTLESKINFKLQMKSKFQKPHVLLEETHVLLLAIQIPRFCESWFQKPHPNEFSRMKQACCPLTAGCAMAMPSSTKCDFR